MTNGNNATLKLKSLDLKSNDILVPSLSVDGATGAVSEDGGLAVRIRGGSAGTGGATGADGIYVVGGGGSTTRGYALNLDAAIAGQTGLKVAGSYATAALFSGYSRADITGNIVGSISNITTLGPIKNTEYSNFMFPMFDSSTKAPKPGLSVSAERAIDETHFPHAQTVWWKLGPEFTELHFRRQILTATRLCSNSLLLMRMFNW